VLSIDHSAALHARVQTAAQLGGILGAAARYHLARAGKQLRGGLALAVAASLGADEPSALEIAAACELLHNASLVHDDIQDGDVLRRGRETVWLRFGQPVAINLGDHLLACAFGALAGMRAAEDRRVRLVALFARATSVIARGQSDEILRRDDQHLDRERYERIARDKTGPLLALPLECAAILAGLGEHAVGAMREGGLLLGTAYQLADDIADLLDAKQRGEPGADLREGKLTWPVIDFLERADPSVRAQLLALLTARGRRIADVAPWVRAIRADGAVERAMLRVRALVAAAEMAWSTLPPSCHQLLRGEAQQFLSSLPDAGQRMPAAQGGIEVAR
jgi:geranylgeranyl pyrophosphate synthase